MWNPSIAQIIWSIPWSIINSCAKIPNQIGLGNCTKMYYKRTFTNLRKFLTISYIALWAIPHTSPIVHKLFLVPILCNDITTLLSIEIASFICVFFLCRYGHNLSQRNLSVLWDTRVICLNIFLWKEPIQLINEPYISLKFAHTTIANVHNLKEIAKNHSILAFSLSANACKSSTCYTIMYKHQYKANATTTLFSLSRWSIMLFFLSSPI